MEIVYFPIYLETHRTTHTQDMYRTVAFIHRFPEVRFNRGFFHWYTGQEMVYGGIENKWDFICFAPELLQPDIFYARTPPDAKEKLKEEGDRWGKALLYKKIAEGCTEKVG